MKVLFVCEGNVGRSQMAEGIFRELSHGKHEAFSAGTLVIKGDDHALKEIGVDASEYVREPVTQELVESADTVVVMARDETVPEYLKTSPKAIFWDVADPFEQSLEFTRRIRDQIRTHIEGLVTSM
ncbi:MAG: arsenate reductase [Parcubacteria group bacterium Athens0416_74]|nr:MAG: arsenate reductase [Parcubacteria group bacterium Athens0416_74]